MTTSNSTHDAVTSALLQARLALGHAEDPHLADLIDAALQRRSSAVAPPIDKRIARAIEFVGVHLADGRLTIERLAGVAAMSQFHFARKFKKATGHSPGVYVLQKRLVLAREMLAHRQHMSIVNIALTSGFASQSHMSTAFMKEFSVSPGQFRKAAAAKRR
ncbi:helix-turn-helix domain-containing protein [Bradyrhizobium sp. USDA 3364]